ncbi:MAG: acetyl/propionyl-CoA carboxylase subunit alpha [Parvibaculum sp.]|jgi:propionyl-CoA carboxylase alpha chain|uniref:acetyl-CoA carboxylase biotin carboxylase subunit n=1 Tax=Parvibaculum sp. TaxID=2024848 RepID=UPI000C605BF6|nr:acetyl/propionyl/methylcrotonyl-CoA carboxylase subunit alpha [Parvibaculum sp.]MAU59265.1 acetyl/propionyl-CoA carboxylase subunit alpha [Parvibaculum sp.]|tara:strand:+ start:5599 stop:7614 length:2016 start_codon:yes stop_codon:yes gene_type:complete
MFKKILIANRGEIACRVMKTAKKMGIATVAVYSDADKDALHVEMADEAVHIGAAAASESYLVIDKIIAACKQTGAEAVHPGYGFLSENARFAQALKDNGIAFIGPNIKAVEVMGDKIESKKFADAAGVNTVPGYLGVIKDAEEAVKIANEIGYPVMIKASAGGGGKGMRIAWSEKEVADGFTSSMSEAKSSFGDDRVFIEKFVTQPRHIEIQVLGDKHGNAIYVLERECSIQRRNQKVIEEAPSPFLDEETRKAMGEQAVALAKAVDYESAGTVEFIVDKDRNFYFLEMNTRLQVEHPVTELITGIDLVEQMIRIAYGEKLSIKQSDVKINGWAIESRVYAEDPYRNFLPSTGRLVRYRPPEEGTVNGRTIRNDTGVFEGGEISMFYDPMIAKLCTHAPDRLAAIDHMAFALDQFHIEGIQHNIPFVNAIMEHPRFREGRLTTGFIAEEYPDGFSGVALSDDRAMKLAAIAVFMNEVHAERAVQISGQLANRPRKLPDEWVVAVDDWARRVRAEETSGGLRVIFLDDAGNRTESHLVRSDWRPGQSVFRGEVDGEPMVVEIWREKQGYRLRYRGASAHAVVRTVLGHRLNQLMPEKVAPDTSKMLLCPMPGLVKAIHVKEGQEVKAGEALAVVEAMKMENILRAEFDCTVEKINAEPGDSLAVDAVIMEFA